MPSRSSNFLVTITPKSIDQSTTRVECSGGSYTGLHDHITNALNLDRFLTLQSDDGRFFAMECDAIRSVKVERSEPRINVNLIRNMSEEDALHAAQRLVDEIRAGKKNTAVQSGGAA